MLVLVIVVILLALRNLAALAAVLYLRVRPADPPSLDPATAAALERAPHQPASGGTRRLITIEVLNPIELAGTRGRWAGIAGSLVPGLTRRLVYDQTLKIIKAQLLEQQVIADVRLHTVQPTTTPPAAAPGYVDDVARVDLDAVGEPDATNGTAT